VENSEKQYWVSYYRYQELTPPFKAYFFSLPISYLEVVFGLSLGGFMKKYLVLLILFISGCQSGPEDIPFTTLLQREYTDHFLESGYNRLIRNEYSWNRIWDLLTYSRIVPFSTDHLDHQSLPGELPLPDIDFDDYWVLVSVGESRVEESFTEIRSVQVTGRRLLIAVFSGPPSASDEEQVRRAEPRRPDGRYMPGFSPRDTHKYFHVVKIPRLNHNLQPEWLHVTVESAPWNPQED